VNALRGLITDPELTLEAVKEALQPLTAELSGSCGLRILIQDAESAVAAGYTQCAQPPLPDICICVDDIPSESVSVVQSSLLNLFPHALVVLCESRLVLTPDWQVGERTPGTVQLCTFRHKQDIPRDEFIQIWRDDHTSVAVETQSTFGYFQNLVCENQDTSFDALVEEHFPIEAATSPEVFFDAVDDPAKLKQNIDCMMQSCARFIQQDTINVIHLSEYKIQ
jgi:hypothetical protein